VRGLPVTTAGVVSTGLCAALVALEPAAAMAGDADACGCSPTPIDAVGPDLADAFTGWNLVFYGAAVADTTVMAIGGGDHGIRVFFRQSIAFPAWGNTAYVAGYVLPVLVAPAIWVVGLATDDCGLLGAGSAAIQALAATAVTTVLLKWATGRPYPLHGGDPHAPDVLGHPEFAHEFAPFNLAGDWAWPSGHTAAATSIVAALSGWCPDCLAIPLIGYPISVAIGVGMIAGDHHWASDVVAGGLLGYAIGSSVGRDFRRRATADRGGGREVRLVPLGSGTIGAAVIGAF
jgi:membrane-associated phospholipid phosphatase